MLAHPDPERQGKIYGCTLSLPSEWAKSISRGLNPSFAYLRVTTQELSVIVLTFCLARQLKNKPGACRDNKLPVNESPWIEVLKLVQIEARFLGHCRQTLALNGFDCFG